MVAMAEVVTLPESVRGAFVGGQKREGWTDGFKVSKERQRGQKLIKRMVGHPFSNFQVVVLRLSMSANNSTVCDTVTL
jgi:hypothetical protein